MMGRWEKRILTPPVVTPTLAEDIIRLAEEGLSQLKIAKTVGVPKSQVINCLLRNGIKTKTTQEREDGKLRWGLGGRPREYGERQPVKITLPRVRCLEMSDD